MVRFRDMARLAGAVYKRPAHWIGWDHSLTFRAGRGFYAQLWVQQISGAAVLSIRGTASLGEALQDAALLFGREPRAWRAGRRAVEEARKRIPADGQLHMTGHSIGGAYASAIGARFRIPTVTFNAPGMLEALRRSQAYRTRHPRWMDRIDRHVLNLCIDDDWIRHLSGPGLGVNLVLARRSPAPAHFGQGTAGILKALVHGRRGPGGLRGFVQRSLRRHSLRAFTPLLQGDSAFPWDEAIPEHPACGTYNTKRKESAPHELDFSGGVSRDGELERHAIERSQPDSLWGHGFQECTRSAIEPR